jgi:hypothetical protein
MMVGKLNSEISRLLDVLNEHRGQKVLNEPNTKSNLVEPILRTLGWNVFDFKDVEREWKVFDGTSVDYALKISGTPRIFIEAKAVDISLDAPKLIGQTIKYAAVEKDLRWCVLTNGDEYRLYKSDETKLDAENRIVFAVSISACKEDEKRALFIEMMKRLSRDSVKSSEFERWAGELFIENRIRRIMENPSGEFLSIMKKQIGTVAASSEQIKHVMKNILKKGIVTSVDTPKSREYKGIKDYHAQASRTQLELFNQLENFIFSLSDDVQKKETTYYYAYRRNRNFVCLEIRPTIQTILIYLNLEPKKLETIPKIARDVTDVGHYGTGNLELRIRNLNDFEVAKPLIEKSYEIN